jgi:epoxyqueuosine reductase
MQILQDNTKGYVSRYALGRDYHRLIRRKLQKLADLMVQAIGPFSYRAFVDSGPVMEKPLAVKAGLGWQGKHTNLIDKDSGSFFFLGELNTDLPLPLDTEQTDHCGDCSRCMAACPTGAIDKAYQLDARLCIAYLTIELKGPIPEDLRPLIGNRIFGCDDCQLVCPWTRFSRPTFNQDFQPRHSLDNTTLTDLFSWSESQFNSRLEGSPIRRIGYQRWLRNIAVALGNSKRTTEALTILESKKAGATPMVREHIEWALARLNNHSTEVD